MISVQRARDGTQQDVDRFVRERSEVFEGGMVQAVFDGHSVGDGSLDAAIQQAARLAFGLGVRQVFTELAAADAPQVACVSVDSEQSLRCTAPAGHDGLHVHAPSGTHWGRVRMGGTG